MDTEIQTKENKMGVMPVNKLLLNMSLPIMLSMLVLACYNIVDSMFVARLSEDALTAVSLAFPIQNLMIAVGAGTGVGINAILSKALGEKNIKKANQAAENGVFLAGLSYLVFLVIGISAVGFFYTTQTADLVNREQAMVIEQYGKEYLTICCVCSFGLFVQMTYERLLQSTGKTFYTMITQMTGAIINIIMDPILIFGLLGFPKMGVAGAAVATILGQIVGATLSVIINHKVNKEIKLDIKRFRPDKHIIGGIYAVGAPSIVMQAVGSIMVYGMNKILMVFTATATAVFGVYFKLQSFIFMPVFGLNNGMIPIVAYNYGAGEQKRMIKTIKLSILYAVSIMLVGLLAFQIFPAQLLSIFKASDEMLAIGVPALRTISYGFVFAGFCIVSSAVFQALGNGMYSLIMSVLRQLVVLLPAAYLLARTGNIDNIWYSFPIAEIASVAITIILLMRINRKVIRFVGTEQIENTKNVR